MYMKYDNLTFLCHYLVNSRIVWTFQRQSYFSPKKWSRKQLGRIDPNPSFPGDILGKAMNIVEFTDRKSSIKNFEMGT